jgi:hypothetical protein
MSDKQEWIITLYNHEDLESFYEDMETEGGDLHIPNRRVLCTNKRAISRNTHYYLTEQEALEVKEDSRVWDVVNHDLFVNSIKPYGYTIDNGDFDKRYQTDANNINWGLLRHSENANRTGWGLSTIFNQSSDGSVVDDLTVTASGKNVDVVIVDGHFDPAHPEFAVNPDGSGGTRVVRYNWLAPSGGTYDYGVHVDTAYVDPNGVDNDRRTKDNDHGCHCAGTVAGNTQGWARDANIYNMSPYSTNENSGFSAILWDSLRAWHNAKSINTETGRRNPTVSNHSYGASYSFDAGSWKMTYRGVTFDPGRQLTVTELQDRGIPTTDADEFSVPAWFTSVQADMQDAIDDGIIIVVAAGNDSWKIVDASDQDYDNRIWTDNTGGSGYLSHRGDGRTGYDAAITVGALSNNDDERKANFSQCGSRVDIYAAGQSVISSVKGGLSNGGYTLVSDSRNGTYSLQHYQGTSMAAPQVTGVLAILAEHMPGLTQAEAHQWLYNTGLNTQMLDSGADDAMDDTSLQGADNRLLYWQNVRAESGAAFPRITHKLRPTSGATYPRQRIRRRG